MKIKIKTKKKLIPTKKTATFELPKMSTQPRYEYDFFRDGVTQSMIGVFLNCREQCRLRYIEGWEGGGASIPLTYGSMMHHVIARIHQTSDVDFKRWIKEFCEHKQRTTVMSVNAIDIMQHCKRLVSAVVPRYLERIESGDSHYNDWKSKRWLKVEKPFAIPYDFPLGGGRTYVRGQHDGIYTNRAKTELWIMESKNLSMIDERAIFTLLPIDLQIQLYLWAAKKLKEMKQLPNLPIRGVMYNVTRRPLLKMGEKEKESDYIDRVSEDISSRPDWYFMRWSVSINEPLIDKWEWEHLDKYMMHISDWCRSLEERGTQSPLHFVNPGAALSKYGLVDTASMIVTGSSAGLVRRPAPHPELI